MKSKITASLKVSGHDREDIPVINPGGWFGRAWLLFDDSHGYYVVEADTLGDAIDELVESEYGEHFRITEESERADYGFEVNPGDIIGGVNIEEHGWMDLNGKFITDPEVGKYLQHPSSTGGGIDYDGDGIQAIGDEMLKCPLNKGRYHGEGIPEGGLHPLDYAALQNYDDEIRTYIAGLKNIPQGTVAAMAECYEDAKKAGYDAGQDNAHAFYHNYYGNVGLHVQLIRDIAEWFKDAMLVIPGGSSYLKGLLEKAEEVINSSKSLRDPRCHIVWNMEGDLRVPTFTWHNDNGRFESKKIEDCAEETQFTFRRLLAEESK